MKRAISVALCALLILSLFLLTGCGKKEEKTIQQRIDDGEEVLIGLSFQGLSDPFTLIQEQYLTEELPKLGFTTMTTESQSDVALQIQQIENFVEMGAVLVIAYPPDVESVKDTVLKAIEAGTLITFVGLTTTSAGYNCSGGSSVEWTELGNNIGKMASAWVDLAYPGAADGEVHAALFKFSYFVPAGIMMDCVEKTITSNPKIAVNYTEDNLITPDEGFNGAENALTYDKDTRLMISFQEGVAIGLSNYVVSQVDLDPAEFGVFAQGTPQTSASAVDATRTDESVYRGVMLYGNADENPAAGSLRVAKKLLLEGAEPPCWEILEQYSYTSFDFTL